MAGYELRGTYAKREEGPVTPRLAPAVWLPVFIGRTESGLTQEVVAVVRGVNEDDGPSGLAGTYTGYDFIDDDIDSIIYACDNEQNVDAYVQDTDYELYGNYIVWLGSKVKAPVVQTPILSSTDYAGDATTDGTVTYAVEAIRYKEYVDATTGHVVRERRFTSRLTSSILIDPLCKNIYVDSEGVQHHDDFPTSPEFSLTVNWSAPRGAHGYVLFRKLEGFGAALDGEWVFLGEFDTKVETQYIDRDLLTQQEATYECLVGTEIPGGLCATTIGADVYYLIEGGEANSQCLMQPFSDDTYYVSVNQNTSNAGVYKTYTQLSEVRTDHGITSEVFKYASLALAVPPDGFGLPEVGIIGLDLAADASDDDKYVAYNNAINLLDNEPAGLLIVPCWAIDDDPHPLVRDYKTWVESKGAWDVGKEHYVLIGFNSGTVIGRPTQSGSQRYDLARARSNRVIRLGPTWIKKLTQDAAGAYAFETFSGYLWAAEAACLKASSMDPAEPVTNKAAVAVLGIEKVSDNERKILDAEGEMQFYLDENGSYVVYRDVTTSLDGEEDRTWAVMLEEDYMKRSLRTAFRRYLGKKNIKRIRDLIAEDTDNALNSMVEAEYIDWHSSATATQNVTNPKYVDVTFSWIPIWGIDAIVFHMSFKLVD